MRNSAEIWIMTKSFECKPDGLDAYGVYLRLVHTVSLCQALYRLKSLRSNQSVTTRRLSVGYVQAFTTVWMGRLKMQYLKLKGQIATYENARHEITWHEKAGHDAQFV